MRRERLYDELERPNERPRQRLARVAQREGAAPAEPEGILTAIETAPDALPDALLALCHRFGIESWASTRDDRGIWAFGRALAQWLSRPAGGGYAEVTSPVETVRLVTNLLVIAGAVTRLPERTSPDAGMQAMAAVTLARQAIAAYHGPVASFPAAGRAMQRLVRVRGWARLTAAQQLLTEAMLGLYLDSLAAMEAAPSAGVLLALTEAWLTVLHALALPDGFDERVLRATSWYLETYLTSGGH